MGGGCVIPNIGVLQMAASRARSKKKVPQKSRDFWNGGTGTVWTFVHLGITPVYACNITSLHNEHCELKAIVILEARSTIAIFSTHTIPDVNKVLA